MDRSERAFTPSPQSGSLVPAPLGVSWRLIPSGPANPLVDHGGFGAVPAFVTTAEGWATAIPWWGWVAGAAAAWFYFRESHPTRIHAPRGHYVAPDQGTGAPMNPRSRRRRR
jgi:hypothetical protein